MKQIKIKKEFGDKIVSGEKQYEFRKLSKGLTTGTYEFVSISKTIDDTLHISYPKEIYGTAKLRAATLCNPMNKDMSFGYEEGADDNRIDKGTYDFVKENYIDEGIDFIAYQISEVKNETN